MGVGEGPQLPWFTETFRPGAPWTVRSIEPHAGSLLRWDDPQGLPGGGLSRTGLICVEPDRPARTEGDGLCVNAEGDVWMASFNTAEFVPVRDGGQVLETIKVDGCAVTCVLGGADGRDLFCSVATTDPNQMARGRASSQIDVYGVDVPSR